MSGELELTSDDESKPIEDSPSNLTAYQAKIVKRTSYFRSKIFTAKSGVNPLVIAAQPIFSIIDRLKLSDDLPKLDSTLDNFYHEMLAFDSRAQSSGYNEELVVIANYLLTATIDEIIETQFGGLDKADTKAIPKLTPKSQDNIGPEQRFFDITERVLSRSEDYLDLVELIYFCLNSGFSGRYCQGAQDREALENIIDKVYEAVEQFRRDKDKNLFLNRKKRYLPLAKPKDRRFIYLFACLILITSSLYFAGHYLLDNQAEDLINLTKSKASLLTKRSTQT